MIDDALITSSIITAVFVNNQASKNYSAIAGIPLSIHQFHVVPNHRPAIGRVVGNILAIMLLCTRVIQIESAPLVSYLRISCATVATK